MEEKRNLEIQDEDLENVNGGTSVQKLLMQTSVQMLLMQNGLQPNSGAELVSTNTLRGSYNAYVQNNGVQSAANGE